MDYLRFGRKEFHFSEGREPREKQTPWPGLWGTLPSLVRSTLMADLRTATPSELKKWDRPLRRAVVEAVLLNLSQGTEFFKRPGKRHTFNKSFQGYYSLLSGFGGGWVTLGDSVHQPSEGEAHHSAITS